ncbi:hypothetical protein M407DRAFT_116166 [Tulasnella calospora MUT 4182]|uniref:Uncharacterized protein n=1 Tax=Tulasnella calospora MUT 4182 TaxID=1051891 RepID=A0A0C3LN15_9AGAM|nr:hypothetical protein M407DRAFT_116166 [Tulasnella calospora MUT 4182]
MSVSAGILPPHPRAASPVLSVEVGLNDGIIVDTMLNNGTLFLRGNLFAFVHTARRRHSGTGKTEVWIWDWPTGQRIHEYASDEEAAFTFLDDFSYLLIGHVNAGWRTTSWHVEIHASDQSVAPIRKFDKVVIMALPDLSYQCEIFGMSARCEPNDSDSAATGSTDPRPLSSRLPFKPSNNRLVAVTFSVTRGGLFNANSVRFTVFMLTSQLLQLVAERLQEKELVRIPWDEWGSKYTRWSHGLFPNAVVCNLHGLRYLTLANTHLSRLSIMDFNIYSIRRDSSSPRVSPQDPWEDSKPRVATRLVTEPTYTAVPQIFPDPIVSCLPYREITFPSLTIERDSGLMMDDQRIVVFESLARDSTSFTVYTL